MRLVTTITARRLRGLGATSCAVAAFAAGAAPLASGISSAGAVTTRSAAATPADAPAAPTGTRIDGATRLAGTLSGKTIAVDAGHNGGNARHPSEINRQVPAGGGRKKACDTTGTETNDGTLTEHAFTLDVARRLQRQLEAAGARVVMTRTTDDGVGPCVDQRAAIGNAAHANAAISIHGDGGPLSGRGFHVIRPKGVSGQSKRMLASSDLLGRRVRTALKAKGYRTADYVGIAGLDLRDDLGGLNLSKVPKVLVELGNMRNAADARLMERPAQRERMAAALATALSVQLTH